MLRSRKAMQRMRLGAAGREDESVEDGAQVEAAVEQVLHLSEVARGVLGESEGVQGAGERGLQVAQDGVDGQE